MKRFFLFFLAIFFPWIALLICENILGAFLALIMQLTFIGWIPASIWAWQAIQEKLNGEKKSSKQGKE